MTPKELLDLLRHAGFTLRLTAGKIFVSPASKLGPDERQAIAAHREGLIALLDRGEAVLPDKPGPLGPKAHGPAQWVLG